jgi:hypothetical protein
MRPIPQSPRSTRGRAICIKWAICFFSLLKQHEKGRSCLFRPQSLRRYLDGCLVLELCSVFLKSTPVGAYSITDTVCLSLRTRKQSPHISIHARMDINLQPTHLSSFPNLFSLLRPNLICLFSALFFSRRCLIASRCSSRSVTSGLRHPATATQPKAQVKRNATRTDLSITYPSLTEPEP